LGSTAVLLVPSVVIPAEANVLINPRHPEAARIRVAGLAPFTLDPRLY
jgi:RES domain-containing protein